MQQVTRNRLANCENEYQGSFMRVLTVCSAGLLRSPTIARVLTRDYDNVNTRAVGTSSDYALVPLDLVHLKWAHLIVCANDEVKRFVDTALEEAKLERKVVHLNIPDMFSFGDPELERIIRVELDGIRLTNENDPRDFYVDVTLSPHQ
jgi:predicted protein tyrosine phosphatase